MKCYLLAVVSGSSLDRYTNNVTLFNLVEQLNWPKGQTAPPGAVLPVEVHAYFELMPGELNQRFDVRFSLVASTGLETVTDSFSHRSATSRYRTRTVGLPMPPVVGDYSLCVEMRQGEDGPWQRERVSWPLVFAEAEQRPAVTH